MRYLSRLRLRSDASVAVLAPLLLGKTGRGGHSIQSGHHLIWSLFADGSERRRDFLWREMATGEFFVLSARRPGNKHGLFEIAEPKPFLPVLEPGDRLQFSLRANPIIRRRDPKRGRSVKHDVVMDALRSHRKGERAGRRLAVVREQGLAWLQRQGSGTGFTFRPDDVRADGYDQHRIARRGAAPPMSFSTVDFDGILTVGDPDAFLTAVARGFGASKAYGCGLMLIRRT